MTYLLLADTLAVLHGLLVVFVIGGQGLILSGWARGWTWTCNLRFRIVHLAVIAFVVVQTWFGELCPLTVWENELRRLSSAEGYAESFIAHWIHVWLYWHVPHRVFVVVYSALAALVAISWWRHPPCRN